jgi:serine/threonine protein kinase
VSLSPGTRIGPLEVHAQIGLGGMGEVYRATDTRLKRQVAIKVLPASVAADPERLVRFQREAEVLAQLNHPNIAQIYGVEDADGVKALVMELVEGPTLADRLTRGALPVDEALAVAKQIAEALAAAHEQGIVHRDLKPANIKVREDGTVKVLDFGLAKALDAGSAGSSYQASGPTLSQSPTLMSPAPLTGIGMILGTAAYMSPEQAKGKPADKRSDIWAFGCVLYEMLTGQRAFQGDDLADTLTAIMASRPDLAALPAATPAPVRQLIDGCLVRDRHGRIGDLAAAVFALGKPLEAPVTGRTGGPATRWRLAGAFLGVAIVAAVLGALARSAAETAPTGVLHAAVPMAAAQLAVDGINNDLVLSSDAARLVYVGESGTLVVRSFETDEPLIIKEYWGSTSDWPTV